MTEAQAMDAAAEAATRLGVAIAVWKHVGGTVAGKVIQPQGRYLVVQAGEGDDPRNVWRKVATVQPGETEPKAVDPVPAVVMADVDSALRQWLRDQIVKWRADQASEVSAGLREAANDVEERLKG